MSDLRVLLSGFGVREPECSVKTVRRRGKRDGESESVRRISDIKRQSVKPWASGFLGRGEGFVVWTQR